MQIPNDLPYAEAVREVLVNTASHTLTRMTHPRGTDNPPHHHPHEQTIFVLSGTGVFTLGTEQISVSAGAVLDIPSDVPHGLAYSEETIVWLEYFTPGREDFK